MNRIGMILLGAGSLWLLGAETLHAELLRCTGRDGTVVFANRVDGTSKCVKYEPHSTLTVAPDKWSLKKSKKATLEVRSSRYKKESHEPGGPVRQKRSRDQVSFETLRMLSTGMTKAEVLSRAGSPRHNFKNKGMDRWVYESTERWIVEIVFSGNKVTSVDWSRA